jgi:hypothetical protein
VTGIKRDCRCLRAQHVHGTRAAYTKDGCRCFGCRLANSRISAQAAAGGGFSEGLLLPRCAVTRRLEALHAVGWSESAIARQLGVSKQAVNNLRAHSGQYVAASTVARVAAVYDRLWDKAPGDRFATRTINWAARRGFAPPLAWDDDTINDPAAVPALTATAAPVLDEIAVERHMHGTLHAAPNANATPELLEAVRRLTHRGLTDREIGDRVGLSADAVLKLRTRHGVPSGARGAA